MCIFKRTKKIFWHLEQSNILYLLDENSTCIFKVKVYQEMIDAHCNKFSNTIWFSKSEVEEILDKLCEDDTYAFIEAREVNKPFELSINVVV